MENLQSAPVTGPVTDQERAYAIDALKATKDALHQSLAGLTNAQLSYKSGADRWSVAECVEHIALIERGIFAAIQKGMAYPANPEKRTEIKYSDVDVIKAVRSRSVTLPSPDPFVPTGRFNSVSAALDDFDQQRDAVISYVHTVTDDLRTHYFRHIALGWLDAYQAILLLASHGERHRKQIEEVKASSGFPA
ncbi:DinB family protein [Spirosoma arcticum]